MTPEPLVCPVYTKAVIHGSRGALVTVRAGVAPVIADPHAPRGMLFSIAHEAWLFPAGEDPREGLHHSLAGPRP